MIYVSEGPEKPWTLLYEGEPPYPLVNGAEVCQAILFPLVSLPELVADPAVPDEVRQRAIEWLARHGATVRVVRG